MKKIGLLAMLCVMLLNVACTTLGRESGSYKDDENASLEVINDLDESVVLFLGGVNKNNYLGGVYGGDSRLIDIRSKLRSDSGVVLIRAIKEDVFKQKKYSIDDGDIIFAKMIVVDKNIAGLDASIRVSASVGGNAGLRIENNSPYALELRLDKPDGPVFTTFSPRERARIITMEYNPRGYMFFPTYVYYDPFKKQLSSITTQTLEGGQSRRPVDLTSDEIPIIPFDGPTDADLPVHPVSYVTIINQTSSEVAILRNGGNEVTSQKGIIMLNPGDIDTYELPISPASSDEMLYAALKVDRNKGTGAQVSIPPTVLRRGVDYTLYYVENGGGIEVQVIEGEERGFDLQANLQLLNE